ncbi:MAG: hypothetical protein F6K31_39735 [Symploca sp. SIO2G7]|nr:hypothetical protein [Symploca sp. SIO2G7]
MTKNLMLQEFESAGSNIVPLPTTDATVATGNDTNQKLYTTPELASEFDMKPRTLRHWVQQIREAWDWLDPDEFKQLGKHTQFVHDQLVTLKNFRETGGNYEEWREQVQTLRPKESVAIQKASQPEVTGGLALITQEDSPFAGLAVRTKASEQVEILQGELELIKEAADEDFGDFLAITAELEAEDEAWTQQDDLEWQALRKKNAQKWLKRRAILERDKQQILQGDVPLPKKS